MDDRDYEIIDTYHFVVFECAEFISNRLRDMWLDEELPRWYLNQLTNNQYSIIYTALIHGFIRNFYGLSWKLK